jgi:NhaA family Na+:H+ antiporter
MARVIEPFQSFVSSQTGSGWLLLAATGLAIFIANSPWAEHYDELRHVQIGAMLDEGILSLSLQHWVNDGLMALFFFLLGLELKREFLVGRLSSPRQAASVVTAAIGGMALPALLFLLVAEDTEVRRAWGIPMATDTAFALMILVFLRDRVPLAARAFLVGLAIIDDLGAILVIALVYSGDLDPTRLPLVLASFAMLVLLNLGGVRRSWPYLALGLVLWAGFMDLGLHGTLAGVVVALLAPVKPAVSREHFQKVIRRRLSGFRKKHDPDAASILEAPDQHDAAEDVLEVAKDATVPLKRWERQLEGPVSYAVVPLFAFFNAGVSLDPSAVALAWQSELSLAIGLGLLAGKPLGILVGVGLGRVTGLARPPDGLNGRHLAGLGLLGGIGFTMSLFISALSFGDGTMLEIAKQAVIATSLLAGMTGYVVLRIAPAANDGDTARGESTGAK